MRSTRYSTFSALLVLLMFMCSFPAFGRHLYTAPNARMSVFDTKIISLAQQLSNGTHASSEIHVAIVGFTDLAGKETDLGNTLSEELTTRLFQTGKFSIVERSMLIKVLKEQKLELTGPIDPDSIKNLGKLLKVEAIITGRYVNRPTDVRVYARLIDTMTGEIRSLADVTLDKDPLILGLLGETAPAQISFDQDSDTSAPMDSHRINTAEVRYGNFTFAVTSAHKDEFGSAVFEILVRNTGPATELSFGKSGWFGEGAVLNANWNTIYKKCKVGIVGEPRSYKNGAAHFFPPNSSVSVTIRFYEAGESVFTCKSIALPVIGLDGGNSQRTILLTNLPKQ